MSDTKGRRTKERILRTAAPLFNRRGYAGPSLSDLMEATGLEKGGIYRHFDSKDEIALAAFDHTVRMQGELIRAHMLAARREPVAQMVAVAEAIASLAENPAVEGGCPLLNTAVECDDAEGKLYRQLRSRARREMSRLMDSVKRIVAEGIEAGELVSAADPEAEASALIATMEGALMLSKLYNDPAHAQNAVARVRERAESLRNGRAPQKRAGKIRGEVK